MVRLGRLEDEEVIDISARCKCSPECFKTTAKLIPPLKYPTHSRRSVLWDNEPVQFCCQNSQLHETLLNDSISSIGMNGLRSTAH